MNKIKEWFYYDFSDWVESPLGSLITILVIFFGSMFLIGFLL